MKRLAVLAVAVALVGCGGDGAQFDEQGVRDAIERSNPNAAPADVDAVIESMREHCATTGDDGEFAIFLSMLEAAGEDDEWYQIACPERLAEQRDYRN